MTDITRLQAIDALIALDLPEWERHGDYKRVAAIHETVLQFTHDGLLFVETFRSHPNRISLWWHLRRKRPVTVTLEGVPVEWAEWLRDINYKNEGDDWKVAKETARRALEAIEKGND